MLQFFFFTISTLQKYLYLYSFLYIQLRGTKKFTLFLINLNVILIKKYWQFNTYAFSTWYDLIDNHINAYTSSWCRGGQEQRPLLQYSASSFRWYTNCSLNYFVIETTRCTNFTNLFCHEKIYLFRTVPLSIIRSLFTVHSAMVCVIQVCRQLSSRNRMFHKCNFKYKITFVLRLKVMSNKIWCFFDRAS